LTPQPFSCLTRNRLQEDSHAVSLQEGDFVEDAPRQHVVAHLNSQQLTGVGLLTGQAYNVDLVTTNITNSQVDGANVTTLETTMNVVSLGSADNSRIQSVFHVTVNANGETTTAFQTANIHCNG
jgi:NMD protein affecting ribosome stability and mRNA decay